MGQKDPNDFAPYEDFLHTRVWPTVDPRTGEIEYVTVSADEMVPQYAAAALAKLVRWAIMAPVGDIALHPDDDSRNVAVRSSVLGKALAARAVNLDEDLFFAMYGEFGVMPAADPDVIAALLIASLEEFGLDWKPRERIVLALRLARRMVDEFSVRERFLS